MLGAVVSQSPVGNGGYDAINRLVGERAEHGQRVAAVDFERFGQAMNSLRPRAKISAALARTRALATGGDTELPTNRTCAVFVIGRPSWPRSMMKLGRNPCARNNSFGASILRSLPRSRRWRRRWRRRHRRTDRQLVHRERQAEVGRRGSRSLLASRR